MNIDAIVKQHSSHVRWDRELKNNLRRRKQVTFSADNIWMTQYRPFVKQHCYVDYLLVSNKYRQDSIFPADDSENRAICVPGIGSTKPFSTLVVDTMPDLELIPKGQCFPRYRFTRWEQDKCKGQSDWVDHDAGLMRIDNISDTVLVTFRTQYSDSSITKDAIFNYIYGVLHATDYRTRFINDLTKSLPCVPFAPDFHAFAEAGRALAELHLGYETGPEYALITETDNMPGKSSGQLFGSSSMRFAGEGDSILVVSERIRLSGIPPEAHRYEVNGRTPLGWFIDRYLIKTDNRSGIMNDPNAWFRDEESFISAVRRIVHLSVETVRIVDALPKALEN